MNNTFKLSPLSKKEIVRSCTISIAIYCFVMLLLSITTYPIYPNKTVEIADQTTTWLIRALPLITIGYLIFRYKNSKQVTLIHTHLHWIIFGLSFLTINFIRN